MEGSILEPILDQVSEGSHSIDLDVISVVHESCQPDFSSSVLDSTYWANQIPLCYRYRYVRTGRGEVTGSDCGAFNFVSACVALGPEHRNISTRHHFKHCKRLSCPSCYHSAVERTARRICERHVKLDHDLRSRFHRKPGEDKHFSLSFDEDVYPPEFFLKDAGKEALGIASEIFSRYSKDGFCPGEIMLHLERKKHADDLSECRKKGCRRKHVWVFGGHVHFTGKGFFDTDRVYQDHVFAPHRASLLMHRITDRDGGRDLRATIRYELTHAAQFISSETGRAAKNYRYIGVFSDRNVRYVKRERSEERVPCGVAGCKEPRHKFSPALDADLKLVPCSDPEHDRGIWIVKREVTDWFLKGDPYKQMDLAGEVLAQKSRRKPPWTR